MNGYYFVGTAGSRISVSLERVDTTKTWEHPDSIDPDLRITAPDGMIYGNLYKYDNREGVDLNASIANAVLPQTGIYRIVAGTSHGTGLYRLRFQFDSVAPVSAGDRIIPMGGMGATLPVGQPYDVHASVLDSRGHPVSSANVSWTATSGAPVFVNGTSGTTAFDGVVGTTVRLDTPGTAQVKANATDTLLNLGAMQGEEFLRQALPRYDAVGSGPRFIGMGKDGEPRFSSAPVKSLPAEQIGRSRESSLPSGGAGVRGGLGAKPVTKGKTPAARTPAPSGEGGEAGEAGATSGETSKVSRAAFPLPVSSLLQNACTSPTGTIDLGAVAATPDGPYTFTLTDITGGGSQVIDGASGFENLFISKVRTLRLDIKDANGVTPNYPVVVRIGTSGTRAGTVALDPGSPGCTDIFFLWHESPSVPNDVITYTIGTRAFPAEWINNPAQAGTVKPVWATTELLTVAVYIPNDTILDRSTAVEYPVKPMAGQPHHLVHYDYRDMSILPDTIKRFTGYSLSPLVSDLYGGVRSSLFKVSNTYFLEDQLGNTCASYWNTSADPVNPLASNIDVANAEVTKELTYELSSAARKVLLSRGAERNDAIAVS